MANYTAQNALDYVKPLIGATQQTTNTADVIYADMAQTKIWTAYPWRWTLGSLTATPLVDGTQDYDYTAVGTVNLDFYRPINLWITRTDADPDEYRELLIFERLPKELSRKIGFGSSRCISWEKAINKFRLEAAADVPSGTTLQIDGDYQKFPARIRKWATALATPDWYFEVYCDLLLYYFYRSSKDENDKGREVRQFAKFQGSLQQMKAEEDRGDGVPLIFPDEPLVGSLR